MTEEHVLSIGTLAPGLIAYCSCGWTTGRMLDSVDYTADWEKHLTEAAAA